MIRTPKIRRHIASSAAPLVALNIVISTVVLSCSSLLAATVEERYDIVVYGGNSAGVIAAVQAKAMGRSVILVSPDKHLGGLTSGGLGFVDVGDTATVSGLAREYFHRVWAHYQKPEAWVHEAPRKMKGQHRPLPEGDQTMWVLEPSVGERLFDQFIAEAQVPVLRGELLDRSPGGVTVADRRITSIRTRSGRIIAGSVFIDATYEGDLMASAKVSYVSGREGNARYGETLNGIRPALLRYPKGLVDPYLVPGDPASGLLPRVNPDAGGQPGDAHPGTQAFNYRMCLTDVPENRIPIAKPEGYNEKDFELVFRAIEAGQQKQRFFKFSLMPNRKTDSNNNGPISTDLVGRSWDYAEADDATRLRIAKEHEYWQRGLVWTLQNHPRVPEAIRAFFAPWGLPKDEFTDNGNWPYALYVRATRRLLGEAVVTEHTARGKEVASDPVAYGSYHMDSHAVQYVAGPDQKLWEEGCFFVGVPRPFGISYKAITPKREECLNLLVPVCISSSYAAYGSVRMEPVFMMLGQAAATAAAQAIDAKLPVQEVPYGPLRARLEEDGLRFSPSSKAP